MGYRPEIADQAEANAYTYEDAARACGVSTETIRLRARRGKLRRGKPTNSGRPTVLLTAVEIEAISLGRPSMTGQPSGQTEQPDGQPSGQDHLISSLTGHIVTLRDQLAKAEARADRAESAADHARLAGEKDRAAAAAERVRLVEQNATLLQQLAESHAPLRSWLARLIGRS